MPLKPPRTRALPAGDRRRPGLAALAAAALLASAACASNGPTDASPTRQLAKAGWSFGFCLGPCRGDLTIDGSGLEYRISDRSGAETLAVAGGELTASGRARLDELTAALGAEPLQEVYGCPDCADGGAAYLELRRGTELATTRYEFRMPPPLLDPLDNFLAEVMDALESCTATSAVQIASGCQPYRR